MWTLVFWKSLSRSDAVMLSGTYLTGFMIEAMSHGRPLWALVK